MAKDFYSVLGVGRSADDGEIKKAFRRLAQQYHPDKNPGNQEAEIKFKEINEAYSVLSDKEKRAQYDRFGANWEQFARAGAGASGGPAWNGSHTMTSEEFEQVFGNGGFGSIFDSILGGKGSRNRGGFSFESDYTPRPASTEVTVTVTLEEAFRGASRTLQSDDGSRFEVNIPPGVKTGSKVRMKGAGGRSDIVLAVEVLPNTQFQREEDDLRVKVPVDLYTALLGGEVQIPTLERSVMLTIPAGTQNGRSFRLRGIGMPNLRQPEQRGDLYAVVEVVLPTVLTSEEKTMFERLRSIRK